MSQVTIQGNANGNGTLTIAAPNTSTNYTLTLPTETGTVVTTGANAAVSQTMLASNVAGTGPTFYAYLSGSAQSVTSSTYTKMALNAELWDTNNAFDSSTNYRFQPSVAGYYQLNARIIPATSTTYTIIVLYKNGSSFAVGFSGNNATNAPAGVSCIMYLNGSTDYAEVYGYTTGTSPTFSQNSDVCYFNGALVRAA